MATTGMGPGKCHLMRVIGSSRQLRRTRDVIHHVLGGSYPVAIHCGQFKMAARHRIPLSFLRQSLARPITPLSTPATRLPSTPLRQIHTSVPRRARYERFDTPRSSAGPSSSSGPGGNSTGQQIWIFLSRRLGGQRAVAVYGVVLLGGGGWYVTQSVGPVGLLAQLKSISLERVPETGRLRFIDVSEASERQVSFPLPQDRCLMTGRWASKHSCRL